MAKLCFHWSAAAADTGTGNHKQSWLSSGFRVSAGHTLRTGVKTAENTSQEKKLDRGQVGAHMSNGRGHRVTQTLTDRNQKTHRRCTWRL